MSSLSYSQEGAPIYPDRESPGLYRRPDLSEIQRRFQASQNGADGERTWSKLTES